MALTADPAEPANDTEADRLAEAEAADKEEPAKTGAACIEAELEDAELAEPEIGTGELSDA